MNAIDLLEEQHNKTKAALERGCRGELDARESKKVADELVAHMLIEEHVFYPRVRQLMKEQVGASFEEHTVARFALARCLTARDKEQMRIRYSVLREIVEQHIDEEESEMFTRALKAIPQEELLRLGARMEAMFERAVQLGLDALVTGPNQELRSVDGPIERGMRGRAPILRQIRGSSSSQRRPMR